MKSLIGRFAPAVLLAGFSMLTANAAVITFSGCTNGGGFAGPVAEGAFSYSAFSGNLFCDTDGNTGNDLEGTAGSGGGVLDIFRNDVAGGVFTFNGSDIKFEFTQAVSVTFVGLLNGVTKGTDVFTTAADSSWTSKTAVNLSGVSINELRITLIGPEGGAGDVDNVGVTAGASVPEPSSWLLLSGGLAGLLALRRRHSA